MMREIQDDDQSNLFYELCSLVVTILKYPHLCFPPSSSSSGMVTSSSFTSSLRRTTRTRSAQSTMMTMHQQISPAGFASLLLGVSMALMLCGSVTFVIGFILMPWVLGLVMILYFVSVISNLSALGRAVLYPYYNGSSSSSSSSSRITTTTTTAAVATSPKQISEIVTTYNDFESTLYAELKFL